MKVIFIVLLFLPVFFYCNAQLPFFKGKNISKEDAISDLLLIQKILQKNHPSYSWYTPKYITNEAFYNATTSIKDSISEIDFILIASKCINNIKCGHTGIFLPKKSSKPISDSYTTVLNIGFVPQHDTLYVTFSNLGWKNMLRRGTRVLSINGLSSKQIIDSLKPYFSGDGYADIYRERKMGNNFPFIYRNIFGLQPKYVIEYLDLNQKVQQSEIKYTDKYYNVVSNTEDIPQPKSIVKDTLLIKKDTSNNLSMAITQPIDSNAMSIANIIKTKRRQSSITKDTQKGKSTYVGTQISYVKPSRHERKEREREQYRKFTYDTSLRMAYLELNAFKGYGLRRYFKRNFKKIRKEHFENLVVDVRDNGGGYISKYIGLTKYISDHKFKVADSVSVASKKIYKRGLMKLGLWNQLFITFFAHKKNDDRYHYRPYEKKWHHIKKRWHFKGNAYIISGAYSFSATTLFLNNIKGQKNVTIVGDETGGGHYGNNGVLLPDIVLPKTKMILHIPLFRVVINKNMPFNGRGVLPDVFASPTSETLHNGIDIKRQTVIDLIKKTHVK